MSNFVESSLDGHGTSGRRIRFVHSLGYGLETVLTYLKPKALVKIIGLTVSSDEGVQDPDRVAHEKNSYLAI